MCCCWRGWPRRWHSDTAVIDCDVHNEVPKVEALFPYLPEYWVEHITNTLFTGPTEPYYPPNSPVAARPGSRPADDAPAGSRPALPRAQPLAPLNVPSGVRNGPSPLG